MIYRNHFCKISLLSLASIHEGWLSLNGYSNQTSVEVLNATPLILDKNKLGFLEGPTKGYGNQLLFTHRNNDKKWSGINSIDITKKSPNLHIQYLGSFGSLFLRNTKVYFTGQNPKNGHQTVGYFNNFKNGKLSDLEIKVENNIGDHVLLNTNDLVVTKDEAIYFTDKKGKAVCYISKEGIASILYKSRNSKSLKNLDNPNGIVLSSDEKRLFVTDNSNILFGDLDQSGSLKQSLDHLLPGEGLTEKEYHSILDLSSKKVLRKNIENTIVSGRFSSNLRIDGMTIDHEGTIYGAALGSGCVVGFDGTTGQLKCVIKCQHGATNCTIAGENNDTMCIVGGNGISTVKLSA